MKFTYRSLLILTACFALAACLVSVPPPGNVTMVVPKEKRVDRTKSHFELPETADSKDVQKLLNYK